MSCSAGRAVPQSADPPIGHGCHGAALFGDSESRMLRADRYSVRWYSYLLVAAQWWPPRENVTTDSNSSIDAAIFNRLPCPMPFHNAIFGRRSISVGRIGRALVMAMPKFGTAEGKRPVFGSRFPLGELPRQKNFSKQPQAAASLWLWTCNLAVTNSVWESTHRSGISSASPQAKRGRRRYGRQRRRGAAYRKRLRWKTVPALIAYAAGVKGRRFQLLHKKCAQS